MLRNKAFSFINIIGLSIGISCFLILAVCVIDEMGYDTFNEKYDDLDTFIKSVDKLMYLNKNENKAKE